LRTLLEKRKKLGMMGHSCHPSYGRKLKIGEWWSRLVWAKCEIPSPK
jgi:hypothetical protein